MEISSCSGQVASLVESSRREGGSIPNSTNKCFVSSCMLTEHHELLYIIITTNKIKIKSNNLPLAKIQ